MAFDPILLAPLLLLGVALAMGVVGLAWGRTSGAGLPVPRRLFPLMPRAGVAAALCVILFNPTGRHASTSDRATLFLLVDCSRSMLTRDVEGQARIEAAKELCARGALTAVGGADVRVVPFSGGGGGATLQADGTTTDLGAAISACAAAVPKGTRAQAVLISDGHDGATSTPSNAARQATRQGLQLSTLTLGHPSMRPTLSVVPTRDRITCYPGERPEISAEVRAGGVPDGAITVVLHGQAGVLARRTATLRDGVADAAFLLPPTGPGQRSYTIEAQVSDGSLRAAAPLEVSRAAGPARVLLLEARPNWDTRSVVRALQQDARIDLEVVYTVVRGRRYALSARRTVELPRTDDDWSRYDAVLLGGSLDSMVDDDTGRTLARWVQRGGTVLFLRGVPDEGGAALRGLVPARWGAPTPAPCRLAPAAGWSADQASWAASVTPRLEWSAPGARPLAQADDMLDSPFAVSMEVGQGHALACAGNGSWGWALAQPADYQSLWRGIVAWSGLQGPVLPGDATGLRADRLKYTLGDQVRLVASARRGLAAQQIYVRVSGVAASVVPRGGDEHSAFWQPPRAGAYEAALTGGGARCRFTVTAANEEERDVSADAALMKRLAAAGGGVAAVGAAEAPALAKALARSRPAAASRTRNRGLWERGAVLAAILAMAGLGWKAARDARRSTGTERSARQTAQKTERPAG